MLTLLIILLLAPVVLYVLFIIICMAIAYLPKGGIKAVLLTPVLIIVAILLLFRITDSQWEQKKQDNIPLYNECVQKVYDSYPIPIDTPDYEANARGAAYDDCTMRYPIDMPVEHS